MQDSWYRLSGRAAALAVGLAVFGAARSPSAQSQQPTFRSSADNVPVFVTVTDKSGRLLTDLTRQDFQVLDNGKPQPLTVFDNAPQPIRLVILVDISGSMVGNLPLVREASRQLVQRLAPGDLARVGTFGDRIAITPTFTRDANTLLAALPEDTPPNGRTPLWQAVDQAMGGFGDEAGRRVILILSDGKDTGPVTGRRYLTSIEISDRAEREDVMIYGVGLQSRGGPAAMPVAGADLRQMLADNLPDPQLGSVALNSGGGYFELRPRDDMAATFARVVDELHQQYLLGFVPPAKDGKTHKLAVRVARKDVDTRARKTYRAPKD
jgi:Ca-activated chloride channel family protein